MEPLLCAEHLTVGYYGKTVVRDVSFSLNEGEILGIVGESGSGKSTIVRAVAGLLGTGGKITNGSIRYRNRSMTEQKETERRRLLGPEIGMVFQDCKAALCPIRTVGAQIYESLREHRKLSKQEAYQSAGAVLQKIGLTDVQRIWNSYPFELSGGMNQRVGICMAMMQQPALLLADEPTSALDVTVQKQVVDELLLMRREYRTAMILVTHNIGVVRRVADQVLVLQNGEMMEYGTAEKVLNAPENHYTRQLLDSVLHLKRRIS